jgi:hypothetical protein
MKKADWKDIAELVGIAAIVASLVFVGLQMRQEQTIAITETRSTVTHKIGEITTVIESNPGVWIRGLDGEDLTAEERVVFYSMAELVESYFFDMFLRFRNLDIGSVEPLARDFAFAVYTYPGLKQAYLSEFESDQIRNQAYGDDESRVDDFRNLVMQYLEDLEEAGPPVPSEKRYVFW